MPLAGGGSQSIAHSNRRRTAMNNQRVCLLCRLKTKYESSIRRWTQGGSALDRTSRVDTETPLVPRPDEAQCYLDLLSRNGGSHCFQTIPGLRGGAPRTLHGRWSSFLPILARANEQGSNIFVTPNTVKNGAPRREENVTAVTRAPPSRQRSAACRASVSCRAADPPHPPQRSVAANARSSDGSRRAAPPRAAPHRRSSTQAPRGHVPHAFEADCGPKRSPPGGLYPMG